CRSRLSCRRLGFADERGLQGDGWRLSSGCATTAAASSATTAPAGGALTGLLTGGAIRWRGMNRPGLGGRFWLGLSFRLAGLRLRSGFRFEVRGLQWLRAGSWGLGLFLRLLLAALQALTHPLAHDWLVTYPRGVGQRARNGDAESRYRADGIMSSTSPAELQNQKSIS